MNLLYKPQTNPIQVNTIYFKSILHNFAYYHQNVRVVLHRMQTIIIYPVNGFKLLLKQLYKTLTIRSLIPKRSKKSSCNLHKSTFNISFTTCTVLKIKMIVTNGLKHNKNNIFHLLINT